MKMDPEVKAVWTAALRSGKYQQGSGALRCIDDRFCVLGVLADLLGAQWEPSPQTGIEAGFYVYGDGAVVMPIARDLDRAKLHEDDAWVLSGMNDEGKSFGALADYIEDNL
jgi:hypothetical protein